MTPSARLTRLERAKDSGPNPRSQHLDPWEWVTATAMGTWTFAEWRVALGEDQLAEAETDLLDRARSARLRRLEGGPPWLGTAMDIAAEIVSYLPAEMVPLSLFELLDRHLRRRHVPALACYLVEAVVAALVLDSRDGRHLRRKLWPNSSAA